MKSLKRRLWASVVALVLIGIGGWSCRIVAPMLRSTEHFVRVEGEPRVRYEPGAEQAARVIARALPRAIADVEAAHGRAFAKPVTVYVCATEKSFERYAFGVKGAGGYVYSGRLLISPKPANTAERLPRLVTHELSHLHFEQWTGRWWAGAHVPGWFAEGLAVHVSNGGGAETVSEADARKAIAQGRVFRRKESGSYFFPQSAASEGLSAHLFYRESAMFVAFLSRKSPSGFARLLSQLCDRRPFARAVQESYGRDIAALWTEFTAEINEASA